MLAVELINVTKVINKKTINDDLNLIILKGQT